MTSYIRSTYQAQLPFQHLYTNSKQQILAKYWIESVIGHRLSTNDLSCLKDGRILCKIVQKLVDNKLLSSKYLTCYDYQQPEERVKLFQAAAKDFGLQSFEVFSVNDLIEEENMDAVASTILTLAYLNSYKRLTSNTTADYTTRSIAKKRNSQSNILIDSLNLTIPNDKQRELYSPSNTVLDISNHTNTINNYNTFYITPNTKTMNTNLSDVNAIISTPATMSSETNQKQILGRGQAGEQDDRSNKSDPEATYRYHLKSSEGALESIGMSRASSSPASMMLSKPSFQITDLSKGNRTLRRNSMSGLIQSDRIWGEAPCNIPRPRTRDSCGELYRPFDFTNADIKDVEKEFMSVDLSDNSLSPRSSTNSMDLFDDQDDEEVEMYDTKMSHTPSSSGDSGYGTTRKRRQQQPSNTEQKHSNTQSKNDVELQTAKRNKAEEMFEAIFTPPMSAPLSNSNTSRQPSHTVSETTKRSKSPSVEPSSSLRASKSSSKSASSAKSKTSSSGNSTKKLSLLFSKSRSQHLSSHQKKKEPHFVKFQSWSTGNSNITDRSNRTSTACSSTITFASNENGSRSHEETFFKSLHQSIEGQVEGECVLQGSIYKEQESANSAQNRTTSTTMEERRESILTPLSPVSAANRSNTDSGGGLRARSTSLGTPPCSVQHDYRSVSSVSLHSTVSSRSSRTDVSKIIDQCDSEGRLLARYKLGSVIGKGHFGTVYRALDLVSGKTVAIKQISLQKARTSDIHDMMQEATLLSSLTHPNIVKYEGFIQTHQHLNIVLEYVENGSLLHSLKQYGHALPEHLVARYCYDILQGLVYLHGQDVVHCDLKAANILTTKSGDVKLSDFGVSLNLKLKKQEDNVVSGTPFWMAPEVIELKGASVKSDIWSLGCTLIELCTGKPPYADLLTMTAMFKIVEDDSPPVPVDLSEKLRDFLQLCFKKTPNERPTASELLQHPWIKANEKGPDSILSRVASSESHLSTNTAAHSFSSQETTDSNENKFAESVLPKSRKGHALSTLLCSSPYSSPHMSNSDSSLHQPKKTVSTSSSSSGLRFSILESKANPTRPHSGSRTSKNRLDTRKTMSVFESGFSSEKKAAESHRHSMIKISFPQGEGICKICHSKMYKALMCKDGCGFMSHPECNKGSGGNKSNQQQVIPPPPPVRPTSSVSTQLRQLFRPKSSKAKSVHHYDLGNIQEDGPANGRSNSTNMLSKQSKETKVKTTANSKITSKPPASSSSRSSWWRKPLTSSSKASK